MAYNSNTGKQSFTATAGQTDFDFNFKIFTTADIQVFKTPSGQQPNDTNDLLTITTHYTVTINGDSGGQVKLVTGASLNDTIVVKRNLNTERNTEYQTSGDLLATTLNADQDYQTYLIADNNLISGNAIKVPDSAVNINTKLPSIVAQNFIRVNPAGNGFEMSAAVVQEITKFNDTDFRIKEGTKNIAFEASNITTGQTRTITVPDKNIDLGDIATNTTNIANNAKQDDSVIHNIATDSDYTLTAEQNLYGRIEITDAGTVLTTARNIIVNNIEHTFLFKNSTAQTLTVKTSAGTGIAVLTNTAVELRNNTVNVINYEAAAATPQTVLDTGKLLHIRDEKTSGTEGDSIPNGSWGTATLNTVKINNISGSSLASNQITLPAGDYWIEATIPIYNGNDGKGKLYNTTDTADTIIGTNCYSLAGDYSSDVSIVTGNITIAGTKVFELQANATSATAKSGKAASKGVVEVYTEIKIWGIS